MLRGDNTHGTPPNSNEFVNIVRSIPVTHDKKKTYV